MVDAAQIAIDTLFFVIFLATLVMLLVTSVQSLKRRENRDLFATITIVFLALTIICNHLPVVLTIHS